MKIEIEADEGVLRSFANPGVYRVTILEHLRQSIREALPEETVTIEVPRSAAEAMAKGASLGCFGASDKSYDALQAACQTALWDFP